MNTPNGRLKDKVAIVTGGASGIGEATCKLFAQEGAKVIVADIQPEKGQAVAAQIIKDGGSAEFLRCDMGVMTDIEAMFQHVATRYGRLDTLVNNAAVESPLPEVDTSEEVYDRIMNINVKGVFFATKHAVPLMKKNGGGSIINISSAYGIIGSPGFGAYHASKGAVRTLTKGTAVAHARDGIRANSIHPGAINTPLVQEAIKNHADPKGFENAVVGSTPIGRWGQPIEIAYGCLFLASDESKFCIGAEFCIDGGLVAQ
ncbi:MAG: SDR family NAD(P)-dependent oxidoreductase [Panacagrimonas sp.]